MVICVPEPSDFQMLLFLHLSLSVFLLCMPLKVLDMISIFLHAGLLLSIVFFFLLFDG
jgi:hypothetical protein